MGKDKKKPVWRKSYIEIITERENPKEDELISCKYCGSLILPTSIKCSHCGAPRKKT
jgi:DNA-directed RNA polymerase subunit RPC12/RpoP